jgi:hypothetical protein
MFISRHRLYLRVYNRIETNWTAFTAAAMVGVGFTLKMGFSFWAYFAAHYTLR